MVSAKLPSDEDRLSVYLRPLLVDDWRADKGLVDWEPLQPGAPLPRHHFWVGARSTVASLVQSRGVRGESFSGLEPLTGLLVRYLIPVIHSLNELGVDGTAVCRVGDDTRPTWVPAIGKARRVEDIGRTVLGPLGYRRHYGLIAEAEKSDRPWLNKSNSLVWRGKPTGQSGKWNKSSWRKQSRGFIEALASRNMGNPSIDVGFTADPQRLLPDRGPLSSAYRKEWMTVAEQLEHKYLLSVEGNDVSTGLKWMLSSNSCVLCPHPEVESWFCESLLVPWVHYVPVQPDLSDVEEKLRWCWENEEKAEAIAQSGKQFALCFIDESHEFRLFCRVLEGYLEQTDFDNDSA